MIKGCLTVAALGAVLAVTGCARDDGANGHPAAAGSTPANTDAVCASWMKAQEPFLLHTAPEAKAYAQAMADSYQGKKTPGAREIERAYWSGWADAVRPLTDQADTPELKAALTAEIAELDHRAAGAKTGAAEPGFGPIQQLCLHAGGPAAPVATAR